MKHDLKTFTIWLPTEFGIGCFEKKAKDFTDAFRRISMTDKMKDGWITDEDGESQTFWKICGIQEPI